MTQPFAHWHAGLEAWLRERAAELAREVRDYPSPIARCDEQLPRLLEQQRNAFTALEQARAAAARLSDPDPARVRAALLACLETALFAEPEHHAVRARFLAALPAALQRRNGPAERRGGCAPSTVWADDGGRSAA